VCAELQAELSSSIESDLPKVSSAAAHSRMASPSLISSKEKLRQKQNNYLIIFHNQNNKHNQIP